MREAAIRRATSSLSSSTSFESAGAGDSGGAASTNDSNAGSKTSLTPSESKSVHLGESRADAKSSTSSSYRNYNYSAGFDSRVPGSGSASHGLRGRAIESKDVKIEEESCKISSSSIGALISGSESTEGPYRCENTTTFGSRSLHALAGSEGSIRGHTDANAFTEDVSIAVEMASASAASAAAAESVAVRVRWVDGRVVLIAPDGADSTVWRLKQKICAHFDGK